VEQIRHCRWVQGSSRKSKTFRRLFSKDVSNVQICDFPSTKFRFVELEGNRQVTLLVSEEKFEIETSETLGKV